MAYKPSDYGQLHGFTGRYHDYETGLSYFRARCFDHSLGRFISRDSQGFVDGYSLYSAYFIPNNLDPSGEKVLSFLILQGAKKLSKEEIARRIRDFIQNKIQRELKEMGELAGKSMKDKAQELTEKAEALIGAMETATTGSWSDWIPIYGDYQCSSRTTQASMDAFMELDSLADEWESLLKRRKGSNNPKVKESAKTGQEAHRQIEKDLEKKGYETEVTIKLDDGKVVRKDAKKDDTVVIIKPDTPTGHAAASKREELMKENGYQVEKVFYDPQNPAYQPGSPTYRGPDKKK